MEMIMDYSKCLSRVLPGCINNAVGVIPKSGLGRPA